MKKLLFIAFLCTFFLFPISLSAQEDYKKYRSLSYAELDSLMLIEYNKGAYEKGIPYMLAGQAKAKAEFGEQDSVFAEYTVTLGMLYERTDHHKAAESLILQAMTIQKKVLGEGHTKYAESLYNLATLYESMGAYTKAEQLLLQASAIWKKNLGEESVWHINALANLAFLYHSMENYSKAEHLFLQVMEMQKKTLGEERYEYAYTLNNLAGLYQDMGNYAKSEALYLQADAILKKTIGEQHPYYALNLNNLATSFIKAKDYAQAEVFLLKAMAVWKKTMGEEYNEYVHCMSNLGKLYIKMGNYAEGERFLLQAMDIFRKIWGENHFDYINILNALAIFYLDTNQPDTALYYCKRSILANALEMDSSHIDMEKLGTLDYISNHYVNYSFHTLLDILQKQYQQSKDLKKLELCHTVAKAAIQLNERFRKEFTAEGDKLRVLSENNGFVLAAIKTGIELKKENYEATAFGFAEMNKGVLLLESAKTANAQQFGVLPDSIAEQEKNLQKKQSSLIAKLLEKRAETEKDSLRRILNSVNQEIDVFTKMLKNKYPKYASLKYDNKTVDAKAVQDLLDDKTALLEYMIGDSVVYIFYVDKKQVKLTPIYLSNKELDDKIKSLHNALSNYELVKKDPDKSYTDFTENAHWFYENLLKTALSNARSITQLIIIPDGELAHLPFETFLVEKAGKKQPYSDLHYLMRDFKISYNYAATLWKENLAQKRNKNNGQLLAMAAQYKGEEEALRSGLRLPVYERMRQVLNDLPAARKEVEALQNTYRGFFAFDSLAGEKTFKAKASEYAIIHLAMHGLLDKKSPILSSLAFTEDGDRVEDNFLQAYEISKMQLNADLVVLSACETGFGKFETGNGTASLARAFMYAGVPSLVVSLWQVNDASTSTIMQLFYKNLAKGMNKAEALQKAKLEYIKTVGAGGGSTDAINRVSTAAHPAFWAPFILIGDNAPVKIVTKGGGMIWYIVSAVGLLALVGGIFALRGRKEK